MKIAIFDYRITLTNPIGGCHRRMISALCDENEFVVFAPQFDNPRPDRIIHIPVKVPLRPLALLFIAFHLSAPRAWRRYSRCGGLPVDVTQGVESNQLGNEVIYSQFCHRAYLRLSGGFSLSLLLAFRPFLRWLDHQLHAWLEPAAYRRAKHVVVPSTGLAKELIQEFPSIAGKVTVIPNPIDVESMQPPPNFNRAHQRQEFGFCDTDLVLVFTALGHFERKGLPLVMEAIAGIGVREVKLLIVGGEASLVEVYERLALAFGIGEQVVFAGRQTQVQRFLWLADMFILPSLYETFSLSTYEAAAAGLPLIVTRLHGVEDFARDRENAFVVDRTVPAIQAALIEFLALPSDRRRVMAQHARDAVSDFTVARFAASWRSFYRCVAKRPTSLSEDQIMGTCGLSDLDSMSAE